MGIIQHRFRGAYVIPATPNLRYFINRAWSEMSMNPSLKSDQQVMKYFNDLSK